MPAIAFVAGPGQLPLLDVIGALAILTGTAAGEILHCGGRSIPSRPECTSARDYRAQS
jgi:hypothetical protein